jgi:hypothetical protein
LDFLNFQGETGIVISGCRCGGQGREPEVDGLAAATATVDLGKFVIGAGEADLDRWGRDSGSGGCG